MTDLLRPAPASDQAAFGPRQQRHGPGSGNHFRRWRASLLAAVLLLGLVADPAGAQEIIVEGAPVVVNPPAMRPVANNLRIELFVRPDSEQCKRAQAFLANLEATRPGLRVDVYDVSKDAAALARVKALSTQFGRTAALPTTFAANQLIVGFKDAQNTGQQIENLFTMEVFIRDGCPRCAAATPYLAGLQQRYPALRVVFYEIGDPGSQARMNQLCQSFQVAPGVPAVHFGGRLSVGWNGPEITGRQIEGLIQSLAVPPRAAAATPAEEVNPLPPAKPRPADATAPSDPPNPPTAAPKTVRRSTQPLSAFVTVLVAPVWCPAQDPNSSTAPPRQDNPRKGAPPPGVDDLPPEADLPAEAALPGEASEDASTQVLRRVDETPNDRITVDFFGSRSLNVRSLGLPAFTFLLGLIDGVNPCAMWVLVFLLSVLVGLNDRRKMVIIAGTFVFISGLAYFLFMSAWLNAFLLIRMGKAAQTAQVVLGVIAIVVGLIHIKDFFAFKKGISLSIPEGVKPTIYSRVRQIVAAESLIPALTGAVVLAVLVNTIELLCTAGIPALYTQILSAQNLPSWQNYAYLLLYNIAYMFDDTVLLIVVTATLSRRRLQEKEGRWLKLVSGAVILSLGVVMIAKPEWLH